MNEADKIEKLVKDEAAVEEAMGEIVDVEADALKKAEQRANHKAE